MSADLAVWLGDGQAGELARVGRGSRMRFTGRHDPIARIGRPARIE